MSRPTVTVAFPLHASLRFVDIVSANIDRLPKDDIEIIVSDRTQRDSAIDILRSRHRGDARITWISASENLDWVDHYNDLLRLARGTYMCWMPHDDDFPADYVTRLAEALDANPKAVIACGPVRKVEWDPSTSAQATGDWSWTEESRMLPIDLGERSRGREAVALARQWHVTIPFRGLFRRETVISRGMFLQRVAGSHMTDVLWCVTIIALGPMIYVPNLWCVKRFYSTSSHRSWAQPSLRETLLIVPACLSMLRRVRMPWRDAIPVLVYSARFSGWYLRQKVAARFGKES